MVMSTRNDTSATCKRSPSAESFDAHAQSSGGGMADTYV